MFKSARLKGETGRDYALRILKNNIIRMELEPGSMVSENELSSELGLSRTPVREALIELSKVNIVEIYPQKGSRIALIDPLLVNQSFFMRDTLECEIIREVCKTATEAELLQLRSSLRSQELFEEAGGRLESGTNDALSFLDLDDHYHHLFYVITGKEMVFNVIKESLIHFDRVRNLTISYYKPKTIIRQHEEILKAIEDRDADLASALLHRHLRHFRDIKRELLEEYPSYFKNGENGALKKWG